MEEPQRGLTLGCTSEELFLKQRGSWCICCFRRAFSQLDMTLVQISLQRSGQGSYSHPRTGCWVLCFDGKRGYTEKMCTTHCRVRSSTPLRTCWLQSWRNTGESGWAGQASLSQQLLQLSAAMQVNILISIVVILLLLSSVPILVPILFVWLSLSVLFYLSLSCRCYLTVSTCSPTDDRGGETCGKAWSKSQEGSVH
jgi:hypothetical protein